MLKVENINMDFKNTNILKNISFEVHPGELIHISGSNGSGKSTLFKIITGIYKAKSGEIKTDSNDYIGALIENPGFLEFENAINNLKFLAELNGKFDLKTTNHYAQYLNLDLTNKDKLSKYSIGMRQKVGIIQATMENQNIILLDEPSRGLDKETLDGFVELINELISESKSVIIASHDVIEGLVYDRFYKLQDGELVLINE